jgi:hypothetical protein
MPEARILAAVVATVLAGSLAACGHDTSSSSPSASKADFCRTFDELGVDASPQAAADELSRVGTPSDIGPSARRGFEVLVDHLRNLPAGTKPGEITQMVKNLHAQDADDVRAFVTYYAQECQNIPTGSPS